MIPVGRKEALFTENCILFEFNKIKNSQGGLHQMIKFDAALKPIEFQKDDNGRMQALIETIQRGAKQLYYNGAEFAFIPNHLPREAFEKMRIKSPIKLLGTEDAVTDECLSKGHRSVCVLGAPWIVEQYKASLADVGIDVVLPCEKDQKSLQTIINLAKQTTHIAENSQEKIRTVFDKLNKKKSFSALVIANLELMPPLSGEFVPGDRLIPHRLLANRVVALATKPPIGSRVDCLAKIQLEGSSRIWTE